ncbi:hypothetical protein SDJN03_19850, partial [Cucurbita argyrosperma subsp. sororia]
MSSTSAVRELQRELESKANDLSKLQKDIAKNHQIRKKYTIQLGENELVLKPEIADHVMDFVYVETMLDFTGSKMEETRRSINLHTLPSILSETLALSMTMKRNGARETPCLQPLETWKRLDSALQDLEEKQNSKRDAILKLQQRIQSQQAGKAKV